MLTELYKNDSCAIVGPQDALFSDMTQFVDAKRIISPGTFVSQRGWHFKTDECIVPGLIPKNFGSSSVIFGINRSDVDLVRISREFFEHIKLNKAERTEAVLNTKKKFVEHIHGLEMSSIEPLLDQIGKQDNFRLSFFRSLDESDNNTYIQLKLVPNLNMYNIMDMITSIATIHAKRNKNNNPETPFVLTGSPLDSVIRRYIRFCKEVVELDSMYLYSQLLYVTERLYPDCEPLEVSSFKTSWVSFMARTNMYWKDCLRVKEDGSFIAIDKDTNNLVFGKLKEYKSFLPMEISLSELKSVIQEDFKSLKEIYSVNLL